MDVQSPELPGRLGLRLLRRSLCLRSCTSMGRICRFPPCLPCGRRLYKQQGSFAPLGVTPPHRDHASVPSPSRLRSTSRLSRFYDRPCSGDFAPGRGRLLQLLGMSLPPCCRFHPAEAKEPHRSDFGSPCSLRPPGEDLAFGARLRGHFCVHCRSLPYELSSSRGETLSIGFKVPVSRHPAILTTGLPTLAPAGLSPAEHASLRWTHTRTCSFPASGSSRKSFARVGVEDAVRDLPVEKRTEVMMSPPSSSPVRLSVVVSWTGSRSPRSPPVFPGNGSHPVPLLSFRAGPGEPSSPRSAVL